MNAVPSKAAATPNNPDDAAPDEREDDGCERFLGRRTVFEMLHEQQVGAHGAGLHETDQAEADRQQHQSGDRIFQSSAFENGKPGAFDNLRDPVRRRRMLVEGDIRVRIAVGNLGRSNARLLLQQTMNTIGATVAMHAVDLHGQCPHRSLLGSLLFGFLHLIQDERKENFASPDHDFMTCRGLNRAKIRHEMHI